MQNIREALTAIVANLSQTKEPIEPLNAQCVLCGRYVSCSGREDDHERECPWRQARELVAELEAKKL